MEKDLENLGCSFNPDEGTPPCKGYEIDIKGDGYFETIAQDDGSILVRPRWIEWNKDNLPEPKQMVLIWYKSGYRGAIEFFYSKDAKEMYIRAMDFEMSDPITHWMPFPKGPYD